MENNNLENQNVVQPAETVQPQTVTPVEPVQTVAPAPVQPMMQTVAPIEQPVSQPVELQGGKKKNIVPIIIIAVFILVVGGAVGVYFLFFNKVSGKQVIDGTIDKLFSKAEESIEKANEYLIIDYKNDIVNQSGELVMNADFKSNGESVSYKDIKLEYDTKLDLKNLNGSFNFKASDNGKVAFTLDTFLKDKVLYTNSNAFDTVYKYDMSEFDWSQVEEYIKNMPDYKQSTYKQFITKTKKFVQDAIKPEYITQTEGNYTIEGVAVSGLKNTLVIDKEKYDAIKKDIITAMKNDDEYLNILVRYTGESKEEVVKALDELLTEPKDRNYSHVTIKEEEFTDIVLSIYTTKNGKFLALECIGGTRSLTAVSENNVTTFRVKDNEEELYKFTYNEITKEYTFNLDKAQLIIQIIDKGVKVSYKGEDIEVIVSFESENNQTSYKTLLDSSLKYKDETTSLNGTLNYSSELKKADKIDTFEIGTPKRIEEMSPEEEQAIVNKMLENSKGTVYEGIITYIADMVMPEPIEDNSNYTDMSQIEI